MHLNIKILAFGLLALGIATQCQTKSSSGIMNAPAATKSSQKKSATDTLKKITDRFFTGNELLVNELIALKVIDTSVTTPLSETAYCDTTILLNDSISYSIISANDKAGLCTYYFLASLNNKNGKVLASAYLYPDCDVDISINTYEAYEYAIISMNKIELTETTISQKRNSKSPGTKQNIAHKEINKELITISPTGQIISKKS